MRQNSADCNENNGVHDHSKFFDFNPFGMLYNTLRHVAILMLLFLTIQLLSSQEDSVDLIITNQKIGINDTIKVDFALESPRNLPASWTPTAANEAVTDNAETSFAASEVSAADEEAIKELLQSKPRWHMFLEGSDGKYYSLYLDTLLNDPQLQFTESFAEAGDYEYLIRAIPIYSPTDKPRRERRRFRVTGSNNPPADSSSDAVARTSNPSNFHPEDDSTRIFIETSLFAAAPGDTVVIALNVRNLNQTPLEGHQVELVVPDSLTILEASLRNADGFEFDVKGEYTFGQQSHVHLAKLWRWDVPKLEPRESRTFFVDAVLDKDLARGNLNLAFGLSPKADKPAKPYSLPGFGTQDSQGGKSIQSGEANQAKFSTTLQVNRSRDPNQLVILPDVLYPGQVEVKLNMDAHFQNIGNGAVKVLKIDYFRPDPLLQKTSYFIKEQLFFSGTTLPNPIKYEATPNWNQLKSTIFGGQRLGAGWLPGLVMLADPADAIYSMGHIEFGFTTKTGHPFELGESILGKIEINMDGDKLTSAAVVPVVEPPTYRLSPRFGGKIGVNSYPFGGNLKPFHAGIFGLFPLGKAKASPSITAYRSGFSYAELPDFYLQVEALYNKLVESNTVLGGTLEFTSIDLPIQLRWAPYRVGSLELKKIIGISAGLTPSYVLSSPPLTGPEPVAESGWEMYGHIDIGTGNFVDDRFIAFGLRYNYLLTSGIRKDQGDSYGQLYLQISL